MGETDETVSEAPSGDVRGRILAAAAELIAAGGPDAATTRAVAGAADVQAPTIYRLFGDKRGLLDAVAAEVLGRYVAGKAAREPHADPVQDLRDGWDMHVEFGLTHPGLFAIMSGGTPGAASPAVAAGMEVLRARIRKIAEAGRLQVSEARAVGLTQAAGVGTVLTLLGQPEGARDLALSETAREAVIAAITRVAPAVAGDGARGAAAALRASLGDTSVLSGGERLLLEELLDRIANGEARRE
ncbi:TetR/AcrR family transcriptional regulator [Pseudoruegeria sp. HB172150]|uniref:TetR/AcrR family transcriptional regulator n=1 Tax=Pseudoruegeria sp. HB172150 TaxID=2721164 RepID=UPI001555AC6C|nr:TetR/AcrR family transcriptional regulator [Pseudoruegeria sp. HB172150]